MSLLDVSHLRKSYDGRVAVEDLSLTLARGEVLGLLGPNGAGKTTTMLMIAGLLAPDSGTVSIEGTPFGPRSRGARRLLGVVPQELAIYPDLSARDNLQFFGGLYGLRGKELRERTETVLELVGLTESARQPTRTFSGGMKRRLNFAIGLLHGPRILILDEPTVGVDPQSRSHLLACIRRLRSEDVGVIYASHYMEEVEEICQRVAIIDHGRLLACDRVDDLLNNMASDLYLYVSDIGRLNGQLQGLARIDTSPEGDRAIVVDGDVVRLNQALTRVLQLIEQAGVQVRRIETQESNLERLFLQLTGSRLRD